MNATNASAPLFSSVRSSKDFTLAAFAGALLAAFALQAGAFLPKLSSPTAAPAIAAESTAPNATVAARAPAGERCVSPRG